MSIKLKTANVMKVVSFKTDGDNGQQRECRMQKDVDS